MQRKDQPIEHLLSLEPTERQQLIATLDEAKVDLYIFLIKTYLLSLNEMNINIQPEEKSTYSGTGHFTTFTGYKGKATFTNSTNQTLNILLIELTDRKSALESAWKNHVEFLLYTLNKSIKILAGETSVEGEQNNESLEILKTNRELNEKLTNTLQEILQLKSILKGKDKLILQQKSLAELLKKQIEEKQKGIEQLNFQLDIAKNINNENKAHIEGKSEIPQQISLDILREIIRKFENKEYSFFSRTPETLRKLKTLLTKTTITKKDIMNVIDDPKQLLNLPPESRLNLTNREQLICALGDAFKKENFIPQQPYLDFPIFKK